MAFWHPILTVRKVREKVRSPALKYPPSVPFMVGFPIAQLVFLQEKWIALDW